MAYSGAKFMLDFYIILCYNIIINQVQRGENNVCGCRNIEYN